MSMGSTPSKPSNEASGLNYRDYRAFIFVTHQQHGLLLLHCTRKKKKGPHFQLPGGHIDEFEFVACEKYGKNEQQLLFALRMAAARELYEETGIDVREDLERLQPAPLRSTKQENGGSTLLKCEHRKRVFFTLSVDDGDFFIRTHGKNSNGLASPICNSAYHLKLKLSHEHQGFTFETDLRKSSEMVMKHSGGSCTEAALMMVGNSSSSPL
mmetsp:Transcript_34205/g.50285  ORF Transcript_34205/g.50285 Transcript_34205/m.50285 type:complete len:211 (+) Transcript_34205:128-760(+)|eukprot:CAMPEP_0195522108 /NCGR_PEP_ID=MMETSP0794_2-20130614/20051_1 /TAXON_ID=515487 /ORGANISM="Stephanopyxis turris, Strain CCMP 815" /LENGTH=210 /DNA_ID=CAMNT_0040651797 /DNA_START=111 /DNA_END=743 /DNA_ORIENTATION=+